MNTILRAITGSTKHNLQVSGESDIDYVSFVDGDNISSESLSNGAHEFIVGLDNLINIKKCSLLRNILNLHCVVSGDRQLVEFIDTNRNDILTIDPVNTYKSILFCIQGSLRSRITCGGFRLLMTARHIVEGMSVKDAMPSTPSEKELYMDLRYGRKNKRDLAEYCKPLLEEEAMLRFNVSPNIDFHQALCHEIANALKRGE